MKRQPMLPGTLYTLRRRCGKSNRQMMQVIDAIAAQRVRDGNQKFHTLRAKTDAPSSKPRPEPKPKR